MIDPNELTTVPVLASIFTQDIDDFDAEARLDLPFTKSRGTIMSRLYERLTKASRRKETNHICEQNYRRGVYDAYTALQDEMA